MPEYDLYSEVSPISASSGAGSDMFAGFGALMGVLSGLITVLGIFVFMFLLALVLYYFTGEKKKADEFMPRLMSQSLRIFHYVWMFILSLIAFSLSVGLLTTVLSAILPARGGRTVSIEGAELVSQLLMLALVGLFAYGSVWLNRRNLEISKRGSDVSIKLWLSGGLIVFSIILVTSSFTLLAELFGFIASSSAGISAAAVSAVVMSVVFFGAYLNKVMQVLKSES